VIEKEERATFGLFADPVSATPPLPEERRVRLPNVMVCAAAVPKVAVLPAVEPELSTSTAPPYVRAGIVWLLFVVSKRRIEEMVPVVGKIAEPR
jgi:hypothetical protein